MVAMKMNVMKTYSLGQDPMIIILDTINQLIHLPK